MVTTSTPPRLVVMAGQPSQPVNPTHPHTPTIKQSKQPKQPLEHTKKTVQPNLINKSHCAHTAAKAINRIKAQPSLHHHLPRPVPRTRRSNIPLPRATASSTASLWPSGGTAWTRPLTLSYSRIRRQPFASRTRGLVAPQRVRTQGRQAPVAEDSTRVDRPRNTTFEWQVPSM
ncbi:hypothetical protein IF1G_06388 [Cordyceps javanica]|uniref:Uncharacterized protein n=1 Tax=Cordyceps javanica TaxID=43265 RepID=A0A545V0Z5_9HYPO|nr:hypothetical protein IF1G_06388 [Cordyceps javanica]TQW02546.1 hypothetical protein IF2G_09937 [Cordyceps javanica]